MEFTQNWGQPPFHVDFLLLKQHGSYTAVYAIGFTITQLSGFDNLFRS